MQENDKKPALATPYQPKPYERWNEAQLTRLANDVLDGKVYSTEDAFAKFGPEHGSKMMHMIFPAIGRAVAITNALKEGALNQFMLTAGKDEATVKLLVADAEGLLKELNDNDPLMFFGYKKHQVSATHRATMNLPPEMAEVPIFAGFAYLDSKDYERFNVIRSQLHADRLMQTGPSEGSLPS
jgi:hypothetical protein